MTIRNLPIIVDTTGKYITRDGRLVVVHEIKKIEDENTTSFNVKGTVFTRTKTGSRTQTYNIWCQNGRANTFGEAKIDIVDKI